MVMINMLAKPTVATSRAMSSMASRTTVQTAKVVTHLRELAGHIEDTDDALYVRLLSPARDSARAIGAQHLHSYANQQLKAGYVRDQ